MSGAVSGGGCVGGERGGVVSVVGETEAVGAVRI